MIYALFDGWRNETRCIFLQNKYVLGGIELFFEGIFTENAQIISNFCINSIQSSSANPKISVASYLRHD